MARGTGNRGLQGTARVLVAVVALLATTLFSGTAVAAEDPGTKPPTISSDKADYGPGELVTLRGSNWRAGELVRVDVNDDQGQTWRRVVEVTADENGHIVDAFTLPDWFVAQYSVTATGPLSGTASTVFTDGVVQVALAGSGETASVAWEKFGSSTDCTTPNPPTASGSVAATDTAFVGIAGQNLNSGQSFKLTAPAIAGKAFVNWTADAATTFTALPNGAVCVRGSGNGSTPIHRLTANYVASSVATATTASDASATFGDGWVTLTAQVTPSTTDVGTVTFTVKSGTATVGAVTSAAVSGGSASAGFPLAGVAAGTYAIEAAYSGSTGFAASNNSGQAPAPTLTVARAATTTSVTCAAGPFVHDGTPQTPCSAVVTGPGGLSASLDVTYGDNTDAGTATATASYPGSANHLPSSDSETFVISKASQTITFGPLSDRTFGDPPFEVSATATSGLDVSFAAAGECELAPDGKVQVTAAGTCTITAAQAGSGNYEPAESVARTFAISKAAATLSLSGLSATYDGSPQNAVVTTAPVGLAGVSVTYDGSSAAPTHAGTYAVVASLDNANYEAPDATATLVISPRPITVTAAPASKVYGDVDPPLSFEITSGSLVAGDAVTGALGRAAGEDVGEYDIDRGTLTAGDNYDLAFVSARLTITRAPLTVSVDDRSRRYGEANPELTGSVVGAKNGDAIHPNYATAATAASGVGSYAITADPSSTPAGALDNYTITVETGTLTITKAPLSAEANDATKVYGDANPPLTGTLTGVHNDDPITVTFATTATQQSGVGTYAIVPAVAATAAVLANYEEPELTNGTLTVTRAPLSATASNATKIVGAANPSFTGTLTGVKNDDPLTLAFSTTATAASPVGTYGIVVAVVDPDSKLGNYSVTLAHGILTVLYAWNGFLQPINDTAHQTGVNQSKFKLGQTIPAKFVLRDAAGTIVQQSSLPTFSRSGNLGPCETGATLETITEVVTPDGAAVYSWNGHYQYNWSTKGLTAGEYRIYASLADGKKRYVDICLTK